MSIVLFQDTAVELAVQGDSFLTDIAHLILEVSLNEEIVEKVNLLSREASPGTWYADQGWWLHETADEFRVCVMMELGGNDRQLLGSIELSGLQLFDAPGEPFEMEMPFMCHEDYPNLTLKTRALATTKEAFREVASQHAQRNTSPQLAHNLQVLNDQGVDQLDDFERHRNPQSLEQAISSLQQAAEICPQYHPGLPSILTSLSSALFRRFERLGSLADIHEAIALQQAAVNLTPDKDDKKSERLCNLGNSYSIRFIRLGDLADLENAFVQHQAAVDLTPDRHTNKPHYLSSLGSTYGTRFERLGRPEDMDHAITHQQTAVNLAPDSDPGNHMYLSNLGNFLRIRYENFGALADIDDAIAQGEAAIRLVPKGHLYEHIYVNNLATALQHRFQHLGSIDDVDRAIASLQAVVQVTPNSHPHKHGFLTNLGNSLISRFLHLRDPADLDNAIVQYQETIDLLPNEDPLRPKCLTHLGSALGHRFSRSGDLDDINQSISRHQAAVDLLPVGHPSRTGCLNNLGRALSARFRHSEDLLDIDDAILKGQEAIEVTPDSDHRKCRRMGTLSYSFWLRFEHMSSPHDAERAIHYASEATMSLVASPIERFESAEHWIRIASRIKHRSLLAACESAISIMPLVAWLGLPVTDRHQHLVRIGGIVRKAAAVAISFEQYDKALEWLEQGRSIVWTQILQLRTPVDQLRGVNPDLADRLLQVSRQLERGTGGGDFFEGGERNIEEEGRKYRALTTEWEKIVDQVRTLPNFEDFLRPPRISRLLNAAQNGPVVVFNVADERCDALALLDGFDEVIHIPLPNITSSRVAELRDDLKDLLYSNGIRMREERAAIRVTDEGGGDDTKGKQIMAELWDNLVRPVVDSLALFPHPDSFPRIWWCATGPLAFLPLHAAGIYDHESSDQQLSNYVISSYTPTLSALLEPHNPSPSLSFRLLSVIEPSAPGASHIPNTKLELDHICRRFPQKELLVLQGDEATRGEVTKEMADSNWLHLACHGVQNTVEPTKSALLLHDGHLTLEEIIKLKLPKAEFAFLSACQTTAGDEQLSEEAVHIAGGMLLAGYRGIVATMWSIQDELAPEVTDEFYAHLLREGGRPDSRRAAEALHISIQTLRKKRNLPLTAWVPFVHLGV